jgi:hypothetical protein
MFGLADFNSVCVAPAFLADSACFGSPDLEYCAKSSFLVPP